MNIQIQLSGIQNYTLIQFIILKDNTIIIDDEALTLDVFLKKIELKKLETKNGFLLQKNISSIDENLHSFSLEDLKNNLLEIFRKNNGEKTAFEKCKTAFKTYSEKPSRKNKSILKEFYSKVPLFARPALGDMDSKDSSYRKILGISDEETINAYK